MSLFARFMCTCRIATAAAAVTVAGEIMEPTYTYHIDPLDIVELFRSRDPVDFRPNKRTSLCLNCQ